MGNPAFVGYYDAFNVNSARVTHYQDIVPHLPMESLGYQHVTTEIYYNKHSSKYTVCDDSADGEDDSCSNSCAPFNGDSIDDHMEYLSVEIGDKVCQVDYDAEPVDPVAATPDQCVEGTTVNGP